ncbi:MAG: hypothetical protein ACK5WH_00895 [Hyphomonadaceae bacterium]
MLKKPEEKPAGSRDSFFMWAVPCAVAIFCMSYLAGKDEALRDNRSDKFLLESRAE